MRDGAERSARRERVSAEPPASGDSALAWLLDTIDRAEDEDQARTEETAGPIPSGTSFRGLSAQRARCRSADRRASGRSGRALAVGLGGIALAALGILGLGAAVLSGGPSSPPAEAAAPEAGAAQRGEARGSDAADSDPAGSDPAETGAGRSGTGGAVGSGAVPSRASASGSARGSEARSRVDPIWVSEVAASSGIPEPALRAYAGAALTLGREQPGCGIGWNTLAAIGQVETHHGTIGGARLSTDGRALPRIFGVALDGVAFAAIPDTDGGRLDGDAVWDRAVGPMQFIPQTWAEYGRSARGGAPDIDRIDDAALSAATMLCTIGGDLRVAENWIAAVNAYNPSVAYNNDVADAADHYASLG
ncbi:hypothetical protein [Leucobacter sp. PH1c]|uniref:hypothetical protein n=1 Tax=Leucobacter sp. PH1c TaxID=1397278 RepID=UPI0004696326|nr:hypothetical protein [Leucobacter sp. PH1c]